LWLLGVKTPRRRDLFQPVRCSRAIREPGINPLVPAGPDNEAGGVYGRIDMTM